MSAYGAELADARPRWSWPAARRYLLARVLRAPVRHVASVAREHGRFGARCLCGWEGGWHDHQGAAFSEAHVHTRYVRTVIVDDDAAAL